MSGGQTAIKRKPPKQEGAEEYQPEPKPNIGYTEALGEHASYPEGARSSGETMFSLGMDWTVADDEGRIKAAFEQWVRSNARRAAYDAEMAGDQLEAEKLRSRYNADFGAKMYNWGGFHVANALRSAHGLKHLLYLLLLRCHPNITERIVEKMWLEKNSQDQPIGQKECMRVLFWALGNLKSLSTTESGGDELTQEELLAANSRTRIRR